MVHIRSSFSGECGFLLVFLFNMDLMVALFPTTLSRTSSLNGVGKGL